MSQARAFLLSGILLATVVPTLALAEQTPLSGGF